MRSVQDRGTSHKCAPEVTGLMGSVQDSFGTIAQMRTSRSDGAHGFSARFNTAATQVRTSRSDGSREMSAARWAGLECGLRSVDRALQLACTCSLSHQMK